MMTLMNTTITIMSKISDDNEYHEGDYNEYNSNSNGDILIMAMTKALMLGQLVILAMAVIVMSTGVLMVFSEGMAPSKSPKKMLHLSG